LPTGRNFGRKSQKVTAENFVRQEKSAAQFLADLLKKDWKGAELKFSISFEKPRFMDQYLQRNLHVKCLNIYIFAILKIDFLLYFDEEDTRSTVLPQCSKFQEIIELK
jgi:hypothetical protein